MNKWNIMWSFNQLKQNLKKEWSQTRFKSVAFLGLNLITLTLKSTNICFKTNDLFECVVKLAMFHKIRVGEKGKDWKMIRLEDLLKIKG